MRIFNGSLAYVGCAFVAQSFVLWGEVTLCSNTGFFMSFCESLFSMWKNGRQERMYGLNGNQ